jgi:hypothetical protein
MDDMSACLASNDIYRFVLYQDGRLIKAEDCLRVYGGANPEYNRVNIMGFPIWQHFLFGLFLPMK